VLPVVVNARVTSAGDTVYGSQATYECNQGNWFKRNVSVITMLCTEEGNWNNLDTACRRTLSSTFVLLVILSYPFHDVIINVVNIIIIIILIEA